MFSSECKNQQAHALSTQCCYKLRMHSCKYERIFKVGSKVLCGKVESVGIKMSERGSTPHNSGLYLCLHCL